MNLIIENLQENFEITNEIKNLIKSAINASLNHENFNKECEIGVTFVNNDQIQELNKNHRKIDKPTDVLSFPLIDFNVQDDDKFGYHDGCLMLGDIVISLEKAFEQSKEYGHSFEREIGFLIVHSMLHLLGYDHDIEENTKIMRKKEEEILANIKLNRD